MHCPAPGPDQDSLPGQGASMKQWWQGVLSKMPGQRPYRSPLPVLVRAWQSQMPPGVPVACVGIDRGENAAYLAIRILDLLK